MTEAVLQVAMVMDLIERVPPHRYVLTKLGREVCGVLLERAPASLRDRVVETGEELR